MKIYNLFIFILLFLLMINNISSVEIGITPGNLDFIGKVNEKICKDIYVYTDYKGDIIGELLFAKNLQDYKKIEKYSIIPSNLRINSEFLEEFKGNGMNNKIRLCLTAKNPGKYYGAIIYKTKEKGVGAGSWIIYEVNEKNENLFNNKDKIVDYGISLSFLLLIVLIICMFYKVKK